MFYLYMSNPYGNELIAKSEDREKLERMKAEIETKWVPGDMWSLKITDRKEKEFTCFD